MFIRRRFSTRRTPGTFPQQDPCFACRANPPTEFVRNEWRHPERLFRTSKSLNTDIPRYQTRILTRRVASDRIDPARFIGSTARYPHTTVTHRLTILGQNSMYNPKASSNIPRHQMISQIGNLLMTLWNRYIQIPLRSTPCSVIIPTLLRRRR